MDFKNAKKLEVFIIIAVIAVIGIVYAFTKAPLNAPIDQVENQQQQTKFSYQGQDGKTALEILKERYQVTTQEFTGLGEFVTAINGITPDSSHFWAFYVNGQQAQVGSGSYVTKNSDVIEWRLEEIK